jgi:NAD(P)-dependent dehydrogenase (short-subunit alcohol dehydrogenase family)
MASACADDGITVNAVSPGKMQPEGASGHEGERRRAMVAETVAFLASPAAFGVTGQLIEVGPTT